MCARGTTHIRTSSLLVDVYVGEVTHNHLVVSPPAVHHHCIINKRAVARSSVHLEGVTSAFTCQEVTHGS